MLFTKQLPLNQRKTRLLYLNGGTSHTAAMFQLSNVKENFSELLARNGIETYTFDYYGAGPGEKTDFIGDRNLEEIQRTIEIINNYEIEYIFGFSYGCLIAREAVFKCKSLKGLLLLDPNSALTLEYQSIDGGDKIKITEKIHADNLRNNGATIDPAIYQSYFEGYLSDGELITASYPGRYYSKNSYLFKNKEYVDQLYQHIPTKVFFTKNSVADVRQMYSDYIFYPDASHWILLEDRMKDLSEETIKFIELTINQNGATIHA